MQKTTKGTPNGVPLVYLTIARNNLLKLQDSRDN